MDLGKVMEVLFAHNRWRRYDTINLIASENVMSPLAEVLYMNDIAGRYEEGLPHKRYYRGTRYIDELEVMLTEAFSSMLGARYVDVRPLSGTLANLAVYHGVMPNGGTMLAVPTACGGHISHNPVGGPRLLKIRVVELPWDNEAFNIDVDGARKLAVAERPSLIVLGASLYLFPHPIREVRDIADEVGAILLHDTAHVLGLVLGGRFPNPLSEGAHLLSSSTHKTFPGPQGGLIAGNVDEDLEKSIRQAVFPGLVSNYHAHRYAPTLVTAMEMEEFGKQYADQTVRNAKRLGEALHNEGLKVVAVDRGFTETHQVAVDVSDRGGGEKASALLEEANIIVNKNMLPWDKSALRPSGIRIGVQEVTRWGMTEDDMEYVGRLVADVLVRGEDPAAVRRKVAEFRSRFGEIRFGYKVDLEVLNRVLSSLRLL